MGDTFNRPNPRIRHVPKRPAIGLIGCGEIVRIAQLPAYHRLGVSALRAYDPDPRALDAFCELSPGTIPARSIDELLDDQRIEAVDIAIPPDQQLLVASRAISAGRHVLCQKPLARTAAEARKLVALAAEAGRTLVVNHQMRWAPCIRWAAKTRRDGEFGELVSGVVNTIHYGELSAGHWLAREARFMALFNTIHVVDSLRFLYGDPIGVHGIVQAEDTAKQLPDRTAYAWLRWSSGAVVSITDRLTKCRQPVRADFMLEGTDDTVFGRIGLWDRYPSPAPDVVWFQAAHGDSARLLSDSECWIPEAFTGPLGELCDSITADRAVTVDGWAGLRALEIVEAIYESSRRNGDWVAV
jgi:predicted dehydrogenase